MFETIVSVLLVGVMAAIAYIMYHIQDMETQLNRMVPMVIARLNKLEKQNEK